jgi:hypothetical protein
LLNNILLSILIDDSFDDPIVEMNDSSDNMVLQSDKNVVIGELDNDDGSENDSYGDDDHNPLAKMAPGILCYICSLFIPFKLLLSFRRGEV